MKRSNGRMGLASRWILVLGGMLVIVVLLAGGMITQAAGMGPTGFLPVMFRPPEPPPTALALIPFAQNVSADVTDIANAGDERMFVVDKDGLIFIVLPDGTVLDTPFLDIQDRVKTGNWEEGLLGLAFHPDYAQNGYFFVHYTGFPNYRVKLTRFSVSADPNVADPNSEAELLSIGKPSEVHNGGDITFGPDGYLYVPIGDGGPDPLDPNDPNAIEGDPSNYGQRTDDLLGNVLRIDVDNSTGIPPECESSSFYSIPPDNPFVNGPGCDEVWATGLRNPWRISFDRETGDLFIADVGEWEFEEVNYAPAGTPGGQNYGWHCWEGTYDYTNSWPSVADDCSDSTPYVFPVSEYAHDEGCSITGGFVYRGSAFPSLQGHYVFADFCWGRLFLLTQSGAGWTRTLVGTNAGNITTFGEDIHGELYVGLHYNSTIYKIAVP